jgi:hypothetical protein
MDIIDYYNILDYIDNNKSKYIAYIENNIYDIQIKQVNKKFCYIRNDLQDNFYTIIIYKKNNTYTINVFFSVIRNDESITTMKILESKYDIDILINKLQFYYALTDSQINKIINILQIH